MRCIALVSLKLWKMPPIVRLTHSNVTCGGKKNLISIALSWKTPFTGIFLSSILTLTSQEERAKEKEH